MAASDFITSISPLRNPAFSDEAIDNLPVDVASFSKARVRLFKVKSLALANTISGFNFRSRFEIAPYDFDRIIRAYETDSFLLQAFSKYKELMWKEGWDIVSENPNASDYLYERIGYMEYAMRRSFDDLLAEVGDQLVKFGNCFLAKSRSADMNAVGNAVIAGDNAIAGYYVIPAETVEIERNKHNKPIRYRQRINSLVGGFNNDTSPTWLAKDVIHFAWEKRPGAAFGTPFVEPVLDDIIALRQIEEDVQNLIHKELFPLYKYKVGTLEAPATPEEIDSAIKELEFMRTDGGLVLPERHDVEVVGANNNALDGEEYLNYFLTRVTAGLGLSPHHLGIVGNNSNRAVTDRLDVALYDKVKLYQRYISNTIKLHIFSELLLEGGFNPVLPSQVRGGSDVCEFRFREIDIDSAVKKENHEVFKYTANVTSLDEVRLALRLKPEVDENKLQAAVLAQFAQQTQQGGDSGGKSSSNKNSPQNQYGKKTSPNIRRSNNTPIDVSEQWLNDVIELLPD